MASIISVFTKGGHVENYTSFLFKQGQSLIDRGFLSKKDDLFEQECKLIIGQFSHNKNELYDGLYQLYKIKNSQWHLSFVVAYLLLLASQESGDKDLLATCSFTVGRASIMINKNLEIYAVKYLQSAFDFFSNHKGVINNIVLSQGRGAIDIVRNPNEKLSGEQVTEMRVRLTIRIAELLGKANRNLGHFKNALRSYQNAITISKEAKLHELESFHEYCLGKMYNNYLKQPLRGLSHIQRAYDRLEKKNDNTINEIRYKAIFLDEIGNVYRNISQIEKSIQYYKKSMQINESIMNNSGIARNLSHLGWAYFLKKDYEESEKYLYRGLEFTKKNKTDGRGLGLRLGAFGYLIAKKGEFDRGLKYLKEGLALNSLFNDFRVRAKNLMRIADINIDNRRYTEAVEYLREALNISNSYGYEDLEILISMNIGSVLCEHLSNYEDGYNQYLHAFNLHQKSWSNVLAYIPGLIELNDPEEIKLMYDSLFSKYHQDSSKIINLLNIALKESLTMSINKEQHVLVSSIHRLKTPITAMRNYFDYIFQNEGMLDNKSIVEIVQKAYGSMEHIEKTVNTFLGDIKTYSEQQEEFNPYNVILEKCKSYDINFPDAEIIVQPQNENLIVVGDKTALGTAFNEILLNACEAVEESCKIDTRISVDKREIVTISGYNYDLIVEVTDNGQGIVFKDQSVIFNKGITSKKGGKGLGLSLASKIISSLGGSIKVKNKESGGSSFTIIVPVKVEKE